MMEDYIKYVMNGRQQLLDELKFACMLSMSHDFMDDNGKMKKHVKNYLAHHKLLPHEVYCKQCNSYSNIDIHHVTFKSAGGKDDVRNLIALCRRCHASAHDHNSHEYRQMLRGLIR